MKIKNLRDLFVNELRDIYHAEKQILKALPKMAKAASDSELRSAFEEHLEQTRNQVNRIETVFEEIEYKAKAKTCEAMQGLVTEGEDLIETAHDPDTRDAGLIASAQKVEHYEIATYGCLVSWAGQLGLNRASELLKETLAEEKATDEKLTSLAERKTNPKAEEPGTEGSRMRRSEQGGTERWEEEAGDTETEGGRIEHHEVTV